MISQVRERGPLFDAMAVVAVRDVVEDVAVVLVNVSVMSLVKLDMLPVTDLLAFPESRVCHRCKDGGAIGLHKYAIPHFGTPFGSVLRPICAAIIASPNAPVGHNCSHYGGIT